MTWDTTWHADPALLAGYADGTVGRARAASVEAHLVTCDACRAAIAPLAEGHRLARNFAAIERRVDDLQVHRLERLLGRLGMPDHLARRLLVTPSAQGAFVTAVALILGIATLAQMSSTRESTFFVFLVMAPLLPLAGVTLAFATRTDPLHELIAAAPTPAFELLLVRAVAVLGPTVVIGAVASAVLPQRGWEAVLWLVPALGLAASTLALGSWLPIHRVAWVLGGLWVGGAVLSVRGAPRAHLIERFAAFRPAGQLLLMAVAVLACAVLALRRHTYDFADLGSTS
jgi:hypothetical protein